MLSSHDKLATAISNLFFRFTLDYSTCWLSLSLSLCTPTTPPPRALVNRGGSPLFLFRCIKRFLVGRCKGVLTYALNHPPIFSIFVRFDIPDRSRLRLFMSPVAKVCCSNRAPPSTCELSLGACVCEWLKMLGLVRSVW